MVPSQHFDRTIYFPLASIKMTHSSGSNFKSRAGLGHSASSLSRTQINLLSPPTNITNKSGGSVLKFLSKVVQPFGSSFLYKLFSDKSVDYDAPPNKRSVSCATFLKETKLLLYIYIGLFVKLDAHIAVWGPGCKKHERFNVFFFFKICQFLFFSIFRVFFTFRSFLHIIYDMFAYLAPFPHISPHLVDFTTFK